MDFKAARLDTLAIIISGFTTVLLVGLAIFFIFKAPHGWIFSIVMILILIISYLLSPKRYLFEGSKLIIEKVIGKRIIISLDEIEGYVLVPDLTKLKIARTFGNGGLFGYYGLFSTAEYGTINCQLTSLKNVFIVKSKKGTFAFSPYDPLTFEEYFKNTVAGITGKLEKLVPLKREAIKYASPLILLIPITIFALTVVMILSLYPQLPERIATHFDFHGNPDAWGSRNSFTTAGIIPSSILVVLNFVLFFIVRRTTVRPAIPNFLVIIFSLIQIFVVYASFDMYWFNKHNTHLIPFIYSIVGFACILAFIFLLYYQKIVKKEI